MLFRIIVVLLLLAPALSWAQPGIYTEDEIQQQDLFLQAKTHFLLEKYEKAEELYKQAIKKQPNNAAISYELSRVYAQLGDDDNLEKYIKKAVNISPTNEWYSRTYITFLESKERFKDAADVSDRLIVVNPRDAGTLQKHVELSVKATEYKEALVTLNKLENIVGVSEQISRQKFELFRITGKSNDAVKELIKLVNSDPTNTRYLNNLASYYGEIGKDKDAKKTYQKVLTLDPNDPAANMALSSKVASDNPDAYFLQSINTLVSKEDISIDKKIKELIPFVTKIESLDAAAQKALMTNLNTLQQTHPNEAKSYAILGDANMALDNIEPAVENYKKSIKLTKNVFPVWEQLMYGLDRLGEYEELSKISDDALIYYPNQPICYYYYGKSYGARIEPEMSKEDRFLKGISDTEYIQERKQLYGEAIDSFEEGLLMSAKNQSLTYQINIVAAQTALNYGDVKKANSFADNAIKVAGNKKDPKLEKLLNQIQSRLN
jgi:tetratricopeptide (TPR) repeat protein